MWSYDHDKISKISIQKLDLDLSWQPARHGRPSLDSLALGRPPSDRWHLKMGMVVMEDRVVMMKMEKSNHLIILGKAPTNKTRFFWEIFPKSVYPPTHSRVFERKVKFGSNRRFSGWFWGVLRCLDLVWELATPPTHIWERSPKKKRFFFWQPPLQKTHVDIQTQAVYCKNGTDT